MGLRFRLILILLLYYCTKDWHMQHSHPYSPTKPSKSYDPHPHFSSESVDKQHAAHSSSTIASSSDLSGIISYTQPARATSDLPSRARVWARSRTRAGPSLIDTSPVANSSKKTPYSWGRMRKALLRTANRRAAPSRISTAGL